MESSTENKDLQFESNNRGGQPGNNNAKKNKMFYDRIQKHLIQNPAKLEKIVETLVQEAQNGTPWAVKEIMDRVDGKAVQSTEIGGIDGNAIEISQIEFVIKRPE
jgi:hypothetical protein